MSKKGFSTEIDKVMYRKIKSLENLYYDDFFKDDEYFELVLCLAYMTLSKEKIIKKDMKDTRRLERLTRMVSTCDIDALFQDGFCSEMPKIIEAKENDNTWILDNIRDSIMHGMFDIDEEKKCFIINNDYYDRNLKAEVPFSWFIAYAKNDILSKKILDKYTVKGFYYNVGKKDRTFFETRKEAINHIMYCVDIEGNKFNVKDIERRVKELFDQYSKVVIDDSEIEKFRERIDSEKIKYNERYLVSFYLASDAVKEQIEKEFPGTSVKIHINNRKSRFVNKFVKNNPERYFNYDLLYEQLNSSLAKKSTLLLQYIINLLEGRDNIPEDMANMDNAELVNLINKILKGESSNYTLRRDLDLCNANNLKILRAICLNAYGLATLVINHEDLYSDFFLEQCPRDYDLIAYASKPYLDYAKEERKLIMSLLDKEISLFDDQEQLKNCTNEKGIAFRTKRINDFIKDKEAIEQELYDLRDKMQFEPYIVCENMNEEELFRMRRKLEQLYNGFYSAKTVDGKKAVKKEIGEHLNKMMEVQSEYTYGYCRTMEEALTIIRNSLSHIGRMYVGKDNFTETFIVLNDYDTDGKKTGAVKCRYFSLINMLRSPLLTNEMTDGNNK